MLALTASIPRTLRPAARPVMGSLAQMSKSPQLFLTSRRSFQLSRAMSRSYDENPMPRPDRNLPVNWGIKVVPQQQAYIVERFGRFNRVLDAGLHFLIPLVDRIAYVQTLKEMAIPVANQTAITKDNVMITIDGVLYLKVVDPQSASYGVENPFFAITQLAQTTMRSELGKITFDKTFEEREHLNAAIVTAINSAALDWGLQCLRYEIRDIIPPTNVKASMDLQAEAERRKRAQILESEGARQSEINQADGERASIVLQAEGEAKATLTKANANAQALRVLADAINKQGGKEAVSLRIAEQYVKAFGNLAQKGTTMLLPSNPSDPSAMIAQALGIYQTVLNKQQPQEEGYTPLHEENPHQQSQQEFGYANENKPFEGSSYGSAIPRNGNQ